jgi:hypothetical protein
MDLEISPALGRYPLPLDARWTAVFVVPLPGVVAVELFLDNNPVEVVDLDISPAPGRYPFALDARWTAVVLVPLPGVVAVGLFLDGEPVEVVDEDAMPGPTFSDSPVVLRRLPGSGRARRGEAARLATVSSGLGFRSPGAAARLPPMSVLPPDYEERVRDAVAHYWTTLGAQAGKNNSAEEADRGNRGAVTGGKQMDGFCRLVNWLLKANGMPDASIFVRGNLELPGFFRPTKQWDLIVVHRQHLVAAIEFKSQAGPSFGNNFNNRTEEALGSALDLWTAFREGAFGVDRPRPWVGWLMCLEECKKSTVPVAVDEPHFKVFDEFRGASYAKRYEILARKLVLEKHYDAAALLLSTRSGASAGNYREPAADVGMKRFLAGLGGHVQTFLASM